MIDELQEILKFGAVGGGTLALFVFAGLKVLYWWTEHFKTTKTVEQTIVDQKLRTLGEQELSLTQARTDFIQALRNENAALIERYEAALAKAKHQCDADMARMEKRCQEDTRTLYERCNALQASVVQLAARLQPFEGEPEQ